MESLVKSQNMNFSEQQKMLFIVILLLVLQLGTILVELFKNYNN